MFSVTGYNVGHYQLMRTNGCVLKLNFIPFALRFYLLAIFEAQPSFHRKALAASPEVTYRLRPRETKNLAVGRWVQPTDMEVKSFMRCVHFLGIRSRKPCMLEVHRICLVIGSCASKEVIIILVCSERRDPPALKHHQREQ